jgi:predicted phage replisome organizer
LSDKKYYWLKMEGDFFNQKEIKKLRRIAGGDTYVIIYLKMSLLSLKDNGRLYYEGVEESFIEELSYELNESVENVEVTISYLVKHNMLEPHNMDEYYMNRIPEMTGKETDSARRKRKERLRKSDIVSLDCDNVQKSHTEKEIELDIEKEIDIEKKKKDPKKCFHDYDLVKLTQKEYDSCITNYGEDQTIKALDKLNSFIGSSGKKYKSHFHTLGTWVWDSVKAVKLADQKKQDEFVQEVF